MSKYQKIEDGEWHRPVMKNYKMSCCDCGLVHTIDFKIENKRVIMRAFRNNRSSGQLRRRKNHPFKKQKA